MNNIGIIGKNINYTFSKRYFNNIFYKNNLKNLKYYIFNIKNIKYIYNILIKYKIIGINITIPYKKKIIKYLYKINKIAKKIKSVNVIKIINNKLIGYNTDYYGFYKSFLLKNDNILLLGGLGGVGNSIIYILKKFKKKYKIISRKCLKYKNIFLYKNLKKKDYNNSTIINCTPIGTFPNIKLKPNIKYKYLNKNNYLYDLIYNPFKTSFLKEGEKKQCYIQNGLKMLFYQANKSWKIWNI
ncbi:MAG: shikimate dehydrogenase [Candidatus Shikimatogenerans sp. Tcar]|uniref:Shikimate dehydrogenase n=1 Tax=Candidatus Shikimatogenerans sp. Tcar TaxID=3158565 RepID=A0AAU7QTW3_9FLAO